MTRVLVAIQSIVHFEAHSWVNDRSMNAKVEHAYEELFLRRVRDVWAVKVVVSAIKIVVRAVTVKDEPRPDSARAFSPVQYALAAILLYWPGRICFAGLFPAGLCRGGRSGI